LPIVPRAERLTFDEVVKAVINDYIVNGKRSLRVVERRINKHLLPYFGGKRMAGISTATVNAYVAHRLAQGIRNRNGERIKDVSNAEINREAGRVETGLLPGDAEWSARDAAAHRGCFRRQHRDPGSSNAIRSPPS
jgi:hypothetical protein